MRIITPTEVAKQAGNKYLGVLVAAKFARYLNEFPKDQLAAQGEKLTTQGAAGAGRRRAQLQAGPPPPLRGLTVWAGRHVVLGVSGGIACYKSCILARRLAEAGARVDVVLTAGRRRVRAAAHLRGADRAPRPDLPLGAGRGALACPARPGRRSGASWPPPRRTSSPAWRRAWPTTSSPRCCWPRPRPVLLAPAMNDEMFADPQTQANLERAAPRGASRSSVPRSAPWRRGRRSGRAG